MAHSTFSPGGPTSIPYPWALVRRGGAIPGKRPFTRMAYLVGTVPNPAGGQAIALKGFLGNHALQGWTISVRRVEWSDVIKTWRSTPSAEQIRRACQRLKPVAVDAATSAA